MHMIWKRPEGQQWKRGWNAYPSHTNPAKRTLCPDGAGRIDSTLSSLGAVTEVFMWSQIKQQLAESTARFLTRFASLLPGLAALIVALLISIVVGWILAAVVRRLLLSMQFDARLARWGFPSVAEWSPPWSSLLDFLSALRPSMLTGPRSSREASSPIFPPCSVPRSSYWSAVLSLAFLHAAC